MNKKDIAKRRLSIFSLLISIFLVILKTVVAYTSNSIGIYSEALNNSLDIVTVLITFMAIRISIRPPDKDHPYGHGKYENFSAFIEIIIISLLGFYVIYRAIIRIITRDYFLNLNFYVFLVLIFSIVINIFRVIYIYKIANKYNSPAFKADLINYSGDIISSIVVIAGLAFAKYGFNIADPVAAIIVSVIILFFSIKLGIKTVRDLLGFVPVEITDNIESILAGFKEIQNINFIKVQEVGNINFINISLSLKSSLHLSQAELIKEKIKSKLKSRFPESELLIETTSSLERQELEDIIKEVVLSNPKVVDIHNISISDAGGKLNATVHLELSKDIKLFEAETLTKKIEKKIMDTASELDGIYIHIEVQEKSLEKCQDITKTSGQLISEIKEKVKDYVDPQTCHKFTVLLKNDKYNVSFHCRFNRNLEINEVHLKTTEMENHIKTAFKDIDELTIHAEPEKLP
ncbi:MAG: cation-efflux pump [Actinobacteria bacterium]|nr:cation-efflux pump [Actinomycetota bacterium]MCL6087606.1 cation-efflux pump [Actinomycetota bacterium]